MRSAGKWVFVLALVGMLTLAGIGVYNIMNGFGGSSASGADGETAEAAEPLKEKEITTAAKSFLAAWSKGDLERAAALTDSEAAALEGLTSYRDDAHVTKARFTTATPTGSAVPFQVRATVAYDGVSKPWTYTSRLSVVRGDVSGKPLVDWDSTVLHPDLGTGEKLATGEAAAPQVKAVDRKGRALDPAAYPSLRPVLEQLRANYGDKLSGTPGIELTIDGPEGVDSLLTLSTGRPALLKTTLDRDVQAAAEKAVAKYPTASVAAVDPATGGVLAVANTGDVDFNAAFNGGVAPGSTFKIVTAAAIFANNPSVTPATTTKCYTSFAPEQSRSFRNYEGLNGISGDSSLALNFAKSCNTGFLSLVDEHDDVSYPDSALYDTASRYFGLGRNDWATGIKSADGGIPVDSGDFKWAAMIGQGRVTMNALNMASVSATVANGSFRQPRLVPEVGKPLAQASPLPSRIHGYLRSMMQLAVSDGTAAGLGLPGGSGAKTGTAEIAPTQSDSWFTAFRGDGRIAAAAWVQSGGHGRAAAGPIVVKVMNAR
ncbi:penicillin-binding transpeptidase domain-containing protein [Streptomyces sp. NPDC051940]|uniref:penicillin-binding transpeptidase domain-containing protein n=1 Tax=Streptomyces sp. NPDC051940 TaxID=3155675 RepID=UPI003415E3E6